MQIYKQYIMFRLNYVLAGFHAYYKTEHAHTYFIEFISKSAVIPDLKVGKPSVMAT